MSAMWFYEFFAFCVLYIGANCASDGLNIYNYFYKEIGCVKNEKYAQAFDCPEFPSKNGSCRFANHYVPSGEYVDQELLKGTCLPECKCNEDGLFTCPGIDCGLVSRPGCYAKLNLDTCCQSEEFVCRGDDFAKCEIEGRTYKEGVKVYLRESCDVCVCDKGFKKEAPFCRPVKCELEARRAQELSDHAAAVYMKRENCCPTTWIIGNHTYEDEDEIETFVDHAEDIACKFGKKDIKLGQGFYRNMSRFGLLFEVKCECNSPPFVICQEIDDLP